MTHDIPQLRPPHESAPVRSLIDLERHWRAIKGPWGFDGPQILCQLMDPDGFALPQVVNIADCPPLPDPRLLANLFEIMEDLLARTERSGSVAVMFARPGDAQFRESDRVWARELTAAGAAARIEVWPVFLASDVGLRIASPDDLAA